MFPTRFDRECLTCRETKLATVENFQFWKTGVALCWGHCRQCTGVLPQSSMARTAARFWARVDRSGGADSCWPWLGARHYRGYGRYGKGLKGPSFSHRMAWFLTNGGIPPRAEICHSCDNPPCCNPAHLFIGTHQQNMADMVRKGRSRISRGEDNPTAILTAAQVTDIRQRLLAKTPQKTLAAEYGVSKSTIGAIATGRIWAHLLTADSL